MAIGKGTVWRKQGGRAKGGSKRERVKAGGWVSKRKFEERKC